MYLGRPGGPAPTIALASCCRWASTSEAACRVIERRRGGRERLVDRAGRSPRVGHRARLGPGRRRRRGRGRRRVGYEELPGFPLPTVAGHAGRAVIGDLGGVPVGVLQGRAHLYEGGDAEPLAHPGPRPAAAGAEDLVLTNAAGSLRPELGPGRLMAITDHINLTGANPLVGPNDDALGPRFPSLSDAYDPGLLADAPRHRRASSARRSRRASTSRSAARASRRPPRSAPSARSAPTRSGCRPSTRRSSPATPACASPRSRRSPTSPKGLSAVPLSHEQTLTDAAARRRRPRAAARVLRREAGMTFLAQEVIRRKRDGGGAEGQEIEWLVPGITDGSVSDAQVGALAMAIVIKGMSGDERVALTGAMTRSGEVLDGGTSTARCSTSTPPAESATRSRCCSRRSSPRAAARCR